MLYQDEFERIYQQFFPFGDPSQFASFVFNVFDKDSDGCITFAEFISALSQTSRGTLDEKLEWAFKLYDQDNDGEINREEMLVIVESIYKMVGKMIDLPDDEKTPEKRVDKIFRKMDTSEDGTINLDEFKVGLKNDTWILQALAIDLEDTPIENLSTERTASVF